MAEGRRPGEFALLDPDGRFRERLAADRSALAAAGAARPVALATIAHRLAGAAGTFGYPEVTAAALALENAVEAAGQGGGTASALVRLLAALDAAIASSE